MKKSYTVGAPGNAGMEKVEFDLNGFDSKGQPIEPIPFECLPEIQGTAVANMVAKIEANQAMAPAEITNFIVAALLPPEVQRFAEITNGKDVIVPIELLGQIMMDLVEHYSDRPTKASSGLSGGLKITGPTSMDASTWMAENYPSSSPSDSASTSFMRPLSTT